MTNTKTCFFGFLLCFLVVTTGSTARAEIFRFSTTTPKNFSEVEKSIEDARESVTNSDDLCGGWSDQPVGAVPGPGSTISQVTGVPGWDGLPLQDNGEPFPSGMAWRVEEDDTGGNGFQFPDTASGLATACDYSADSVTRSVWEDAGDEPGRYVQKDFANPYFDDPSCSWNADGNDGGPGTPGRCAQFCQWLNRFTYKDCQIFRRTKNRDGWQCAAWAEKFTCSEEWATIAIAPEESSSSSPEFPETGKSSDSSSSSSEPEKKPGPPTPAPELGIENCVLCTGDECRCPGPGCMTLPSRQESDGSDDPLRAPGPERNVKSFPSFFRQYTAVTARDAVQGTVLEGDDQLYATESKTACYGRYNEEDPKVRRTESQDKRCVISFPFTRGELWKSQMVVGDMTPGPALYDPPPDVREGNDDDLWTQIPGGMSFPREDKLKKRTLTSVFLQPGEKRITAMWQNLVTRPYAENGFLRATDGAVTNETRDARPVVQWINRLTQDMVALLSPPVVRLKIPASWIAVSQSSESSSPGGDAVESFLALQNATVDRQLDAEEDVPGKLIALAEEFFTLQEEIIPVVIPLASPLELEAHAVSESADNPEKAAKLREYARQIDKYRELRARVTLAAAQLLGQQQTDRAAFTQWIEDTAGEYRAFLDRREERLALAPLVRQVQDELDEFSAINSPWCRNNMLTTPDYSRLYPWYPGMPGELPAMSCRGDEGTLPILCIAPEKDFVFDMTRFSSHSAPLRFPVLHPVQILLDLESDVLPDLPDIPDMDDLLGQINGTTVMSGPAETGFPPQIDLESAKANLERAMEILSGRNATYKETWDALEPSDLTESLTCPGWDAFPCVYDEMSLRQWMQDVTAMPGVSLPEQLRVQGTHRDLLAPVAAPDGFDLARTIGCNPEDHVCTPVLHNERRPPSTGEEVLMPDGQAEQQDAVFENIRIRMRRLNIDDNGQSAGRAPKSQMPAIQQYPLYTVPPAIDLLRKQP